MADQDQSEPEGAANVPSVTPPGVALDPMVALATSVHAGPGVYALLLGSGVSTGAGVLTGWQVVTDLVRRVAAATGPGRARRLLSDAERIAKSIMDKFRMATTLARIEEMPLGITTAKILGLGFR